MDYTEANEPHDDQIQAWVEQVLEALMPWLKDPESYDDKIMLAATLGVELKEIAVAAHTAGTLRFARETK